ncbi:F-box-like domain superfamily [Sesbania bispinosa]|nr:F-box-like domain superfamily [Sesbania bispinosa]
MENEKNVKEVHDISLLDLPEMALDCILKGLSPIELCRMLEVCTSLRDKCRSDHLWESHIKHKWGRVISDFAYKEWQLHIKAAKEGNILNQRINLNGSLGSFSGVWPNLYLGSYLEDCLLLNGQRSNNFMMALFFSLQSGGFWFPAQVYKVSIWWLAMSREEPEVGYDNLKPGDHIEIQWRGSAQSPYGMFLMPQGAASSLK